MLRLCRNHNLLLEESNRWRGDKRGRRKPVYSGTKKTSNIHRNKDQQDFPGHLSSQIRHSDFELCC
jgi:hypothetical protein